jgi:hypothetical protein
MAVNAESVLRRQLKSLEAKITLLFRREIIRQKLIKTGLMRDTTRAILVEKPRGFEIEVISTDYNVFVDARFNVTNNVINSRQFEKLYDEINEYFAEYYANKIEDELKK